MDEISYFALLPKQLRYERLSELSGHYAAPPIARPTCVLRCSYYYISSSLLA